MRALLAVVDRLSFAAAVVAAACLVLLAALVLAQVASITLFNRSIEVTWEYGAFLMAAAFFLGLPYTLNSGGHVRVQILHEGLPPRAQRLLDLAATVVGLGIALFLTTALAKLAWGSWLDGSRTFTATATPLVIPQAIVALGAALFALQLLARAVRLLTGRAPDTAQAARDEHV